MATNENEILSQGAKANANGKIGEDMLVPLFETNGYTVIKWSEFRDDNNLIAKIEAGQKSRKIPKRYCDYNKLVIKQYPFQSIYDHKGQTEFLIINKEKDRRLRVECKWQQAAGSVDEKFPYVWLNCVFGYKEKEIIVIIDGGGFKPGALKWIKTQAENRWLLEEQKDKSVEIMNLAEFISFFNQSLR